MMNMAEIEIVLYSVVPTALTYTLYESSEI